MRGRVRHVPLFVVALAATLFAAAAAQGQGAVVIDSSPTGVIVELIGQNVYRGVTPWRLDRGLSGTYEIRAFKAGYDDWEGFALLSATRQDSIFIRMTRKTPLGAGVRSAIVPGWGQIHTGQTAKGVLFLTAEAAAFAGVLWADAKRDDAQQTYTEARLEYLAADQVDEIDDAYIEMRKAYDELYRWHENRKHWAYAAAAVWIANIVDAVVLFPSPPRGGYSALPPGEESGFFASIEPDRTTAGFVIRF
jgi:hypothetical protein